MSSEFRGAPTADKYSFDDYKWLKEQFGTIGGISERQKKKLLVSFLSALSTGEFNVLKDAISVSNKISSEIKEKLLGLVTDVAMRCVIRDADPTAS